MEAEQTPLSEHERLKAMVHDLSLRLEEIQFSRKQTNTTVVNQSSSTQSSTSPYWSCETIESAYSAGPPAVGMDLSSTATDWDAAIDAYVQRTKYEYALPAVGGSLFMPTMGPTYHNRAILVFENPGAPFTVNGFVESYSGAAGSSFQVKVNTTVNSYSYGAGDVSEAVAYTVQSGRNRIAVVERSNSTGGGATAFAFLALKAKLLTSDVSWVEGNE